MFFHLLRSVPSTSQHKERKGHGPACWLINFFVRRPLCEFGLGMELANEKMRERILKFFKQAIENEHTPADAKESMRMDRHHVR